LPQLQKVLQKDRRKRMMSLLKPWMTQKTRQQNLKLAAMKIENVVVVDKAAEEVPAARVDHKDVVQPAGLVAVATGQGPQAVADN
jgi:hypothetical protein